VRGEWWITKDGAEFADGDIGDAGHELIAISTILPDRDAVVEAIVQSVREGKWVPDWVPRLQEGAGADYENGGAQVWYEYGHYINEEQGTALVGSLEVWKALKKQDARYVFARYYGAIRVINRQFELWELTADAIHAIQEFLYDQASGEDMTGGDQEICLEEIKTQNYTCVAIDEFLTAKHPRDVWGR